MPRYNFAPPRPDYPAASVAHLSSAALSQRIRKRIEEAFGWIKEIALQRRARHRGKDRVGWQFTLAAAAYNLIGLPKLLAA